MLKPYGILVACFLLLIGLSAILNEHDGAASTVFPTKRQSTPDQSDCSFRGNSDLYGLGIRLGFYLQLLASYIANQMSLDDDISNLLDTNSTFMAAIFVAAVVLSSPLYTDSGQGAHVEEVFIILYVL